MSASPSAPRPRALPFTHTIIFNQCSPATEAGDCDLLSPPPAHPDLPPARMEGERIFTVHVVWFKRDLRLHDHTPLAAASAAGAVLPLYIVEPMLWRQPDAAARHWRQVCAALAELADDLRRLDLNLVIRTGEATEILSALHAARPIEGLWSHQETGNALSLIHI